MLQDMFVFFLSLSLLHNNNNRILIINININIHSCLAETEAVRKLYQQGGGLPLWLRAPGKAASFLSLPEAVVLAFSP